MSQKICTTTEVATNAYEIRDFTSYCDEFIWQPVADEIMQ